MELNGVLIEEYKSPLGVMRLGVTGDGLCLCDWPSEARDARMDQRLSKYLGPGAGGDREAIIEEARRQLDEYFAGTRREFTVAVRLAGTEFQQKVWRRLAEIPYGETLSYGELAESMGQRSAVRAVASACGANCLSIFVPCHRVIGADGSLTGYAGGVDAKRALLRMEAGL